MFISPAYAQMGGFLDASGGLMQILPFLLIFVVFYFLLIRPQQQKAKQHKATLAQLRRGDRIITAGGIIGTVAKVVSDDEVSVEISEGVRIRVVRSTISTIIAKTEPVAAKDGAKAEDDKDEAADAEPADGAKRAPGRRKAAADK